MTEREKTAPHIKSRGNAADLPLSPVNTIILADQLTTHFLDVTPKIFGNNQVVLRYTPMVPIPKYRIGSNFS
jgi:hypothetical protein